MPRLANDRNELYAKHRAKGMIPSKAAQAAGYAQGSSTTHLEQDDEIVARIHELRDEHEAHRAAQRAAAVEAAKVVGQLTGVERSWVIAKLAENAQLAQQKEDFKESNAALKLIGDELGMFRGGSGEEGGSAVPQTHNLDNLEALLNSAVDALPAAELSPIEQSRQFGEDTALSLIEGQVKKPRLSEERKLTTGSETDVALMSDEDGWTQIDPNTPPEDIYRLALGEED